LTANNIRAIHKRGLTPQQIAKAFNLDLAKICYILINQHAEMDTKIESFSEWTKRVGKNKIAVKMPPSRLGLIFGKTN
jgi:hypothetical protein